MSDMKDKPSVTVIGDLVDSRRSVDRAAVHARFERAIDAINASYAPPVPLRIGLGDEFQGIFASLGEAIGATLRLRMALLPDVDVRQGIGWGRVQVLSEEPRVEDGPGWWAARAAITLVRLLRAEGAAASGADGVRRCRRLSPGRIPRLVNAALMTRDQIVSGLSERSMSVLDGLLRGRQQQEIADDLGISPSAVSQRIRADGIGVVLATDETGARTVRGVAR